MSERRTLNLWFFFAGLAIFAREFSGSRAEARPTAPVHSPACPTPFSPRPNPAATLRRRRQAPSHELKEAAGMNTSTPTSTRYDFLDWLRVIAIFVLLFFHTGMLFVGWGWHIENADVLTELQLPMGILHRLRMPLLLPLVAGMFLVVPPQIFIERLFRGQWDGGYVAFFFERVLQLHPYPSGDFSWHHLWFVAYLYVYVFLLLPLLLWWRSAKKAVKPGAWLYALAIPLVLNEALLKPLYPESHKLIGDWYIFNHYFLFTAYGCLLASMRDAWDWLAARRQLSLGVALIVFGTAMLLLKAGVIER